MFYVEIFLIMNFTVLCAILVVLWQIRDHVVASSGRTLAEPRSEAKPPAP